MSAHKGLAGLLIFAVAVSTMLASSVLSPISTYAANNTTINFQARLEDSAGAIVEDGNYNVEFKLYNASTGGSALWTEDDTYVNSSTDNRIRVVNGYLTTSLGAITPFPSTIPWDQDLYLTMNIGGTSTTPSYDGEMNPRLKLTAVPYAFQAKSASQVSVSNGSNIATLTFTTPTANDSIVLPDASGTVCLTGSTSCNFAPTTGGSGYIQNGTTLQTGANFNIQSSSTSAITGVVKALTGQTADLLQFDNSSGTALSGINANGQIYYQSGSYTGTIAQNTLAENTTYYLPDPGTTTATICLTTGNCAGSGGGITGSGTTNYVSKFNSSSTLAASTQLYDNGNFVGVGTTTNSAKLSVLSANASQSGIFVQAAANATTPTLLVKGGATPGVGGDLADFQTSAGTIVASVDSSGDLAAANATFAGNISVGGTSTLTGNSSVGGTLGITGLLTTNAGITDTGSITQSGSGTFSTGTGAVTLNGSTSISGSNTLSVGTGATSLGGTLAVTGNTTVAGALGVTGSSTLGNVMIQGTGGLTVGNPGSQTGNLYFATSSNSSQLTDIQAQAPTGTGNVTYILPTAIGGNSYTLCTTAGNCAGSGSGATAVGGNADYIAKFSAAQSITDSSIYDNGAFVGLNTSLNSGLLSIQGAVSTQSTIFAQSIASATVPVAVIEGGATPGSSADLLDLDTTGTVVAAKFDSAGNLSAPNGSFSGTLGVSGAATFNGSVSVTGTNTLGIGTSSPSASFQVANQTATQVAEIVQAASGQTADLLELQNNGGTVLAKVDASGNFTAVNGTFTGFLGVTGATSLSGTLGVTGAATFNSVATFNAGATISTGNTFTNAGSTLNTSIAIADHPSGGSIGSAASTVDGATSFDVSQSTASQTLLLPAPTNTTAGRIVYITNTGSAAYTMYGVTSAPGTTQDYVWNGSAWTVNGSGTTGNYIQNGLTQQAGSNFNISGSGIIGTNLSVAGNGAVTGTLGVTGASTLNGGLAVSGVTTLNGNSTISGSNTLSVGTGATTLGGSLSVAGLASLTGGATITGATAINTTGTAATTIGSSTSATTVSGTLTTGGLATFSAGITGTGNILQTGAGTFTTGSGAVALNGATTDASTLGVSGLASLSGGLTISTGTTLTNAGATLLSAKSIADVSAGGNIGTSAATVDGATTFSINQITTGQTLLLPSPTVTTAGRIVYITNTGSASFSLYGATIKPGATQEYVWNGTAWTLNDSGTISSYIQNSTTRQTANFNIQSAAVGSVGAAIQDLSGQTADLLDLDNSSGTPLAKFDANGNLSAVAGTFSGLLTASAGETETGTASLTGTTTVNTTGSANTSINTGTNTGTTTIGNASSATSIGGNLTTTGTTTNTGAVTNNSTTTLNGNTSVSGSNTLTVGTGATALGGTLAVTGTTTDTGLLTTNGGITDTGVFSQTGTGTFSTGTGAISLNGATTDSSTFNVTGATTLSTATVQGSGGLTLGSTTNTGLLSLLDGTTDGFTTSVKTATQANNVALTIPADTNTTDQICLKTLNNCAASGGAIGGTGTANYVARYTGTNTLSTGVLYDNGTGVSVGGTSPGTGGLFNVGTSNQFQVSAAGNVTSGTITSGLINGQTISSTASFTGTVATVGSITDGGSLSVTSSATIGTGLTVTAGGATITAGGLTVTAGASTFGGNVTVNGSNTFTVGTGATSLGGTLGVTGLATFSAGETETGTASLTGTTTVNTTGSANTSINTGTNTGTTTIGNASSATSIGGNLTTTGTTTNTGAVTNNSTTTLNGNTSVSGSNTLTVGTGATALGGTLAVTGTTTDTGLLTTNGGITDTGVFSQTGTGTFSTGTGAISLNGATTDSSTFNVTGATTLSTATVQGSGGLTLGSTTNTGLLSLLDGTTDGFTTSVKTATQANNVALTIPADTNTTDQICLKTLNNCAASGGAIGGTGTANYVARYTGTNTLSTGVLYDNGTGVSVGGTSPGTGGLFNVGTSNQFQVSAAGNVTSGTITSGLINGQTISSTASFTGTVATVGSITDGGSLSVTSSATIGTGLTVTAGGATITAGGLTVTAGASTFGGTVALNSLGAATNNTALCYNSSNQVASCSGTFETTTGTDFIKNQTAGPQSAGFDIQTPSASTIGGSIEATSGQTADLFDLLQSSGAKADYFNASGSLVVGTTQVTGARLTVNAFGATNIDIAVKGYSGQTADLQEFQDNNGIIESKFGASGQLTLGTVATTGGTYYQGQLALSDGTNDGFTSTLQSSTVTANQTFTLPTTGGILCTTTTCASSTGSVSTSTAGQNNYIAKFTGAGTIADSELYDSGTGLSVGSTTTTGLLNVGTAAQFQVSSTGAVIGSTYNGQTISSAASFTGSLATVGNISDGGNLTTTGTTTNTGAVTNNSTTTLNGNTAISGTYTLTVGTGATSLGGTLGVTGLTTLSGGATIAGTTGITGTTTINTTGTGTTTIGNASSATSIGGNLTTTGTTTNTGAVTNNSTTTLNGNTSVSGSNTLTVGTGATALGGTLAVTGTTTDTGLLTTNGGITDTGVFSQTGTGTFSTGTGAISLNGATTDSSTFNVTGATTLSTATVQGSGGLTLGSTTNTGLLSLLDGTTDGFTTSVKTATQANNVALTIPADTNTTDQICLKTLNNCAASGGAIGGTGTANYVARYTGTNTLSTGVLYDNGTGVSVGGTSPGTGGLFNVGTSNQFQVSAAGNVTSGTITSGLINGQTISSTASFTGTVATVGSITDGGSLSVTSSATIGTGLTVTAGGATITAGGLTVTAGASTFGGNVTVNGSNTFTVGTGATSLGGTLGVTGLATFSAGETETGTASLTGTTTVNTTGSANTSINTGTNTGTTTIGNASSATSVGGTLGVTGATTLSTATVQGAGGLTLGTASNSGLLTFLDGTSDGFATTLKTVIQANNLSLTVPADTNTTDQICLKTLNNCAASGGAIGGTGTANYVARYTGTSTLGTGLLYDNGSFVGDNTTSNGGELSIVSSSTTESGLFVQGLASGSVANAIIQEGTSQSGDLLDLNTSGAAVIDRFDSAGDLGLGGTGATRGSRLGITTTASLIGETIEAASSQSADLLDLDNSGGVPLAKFDANGNLTANAGSFSGLVTASAGLTETGTASINASGTSGTTIGNSTSTTGIGGALSVSGATTFSNSEAQTYSSAVSGTENAINTTNTNTSGTADTLNSLSIAPAGSVNSSATNTTNALNLAGVSITSGNVFNAINIGNTNYNSILNVGGTSIINGSGVVQTGGIQGSYSGLTGTGALTSGSIASGFGTISTANNITTSATVQGNIVNATGSGSSLQLGGTSINTPGILTNVAYLTATSQSFTGANTFSATGTALTVTNAASVGTLTVTTGGASITGNSSITGTLGVSGLLTASAGETETGTASLTGTTTINTTGSANTSIGASGSTTTITGTTNLNTTGSATTTIGNASSATSIGGTLAVTGATTLSTAAIQGAGGLTLGSTSNAGLLSFLDGTTDGFITSVKTATQANNVALSIPADTYTTDTICLKSLANCTASGSTTSSGTANYVARFTGTSTLGTGLLYDNGTFVGDNTATTLGGVLSVLGSGATTGLVVEAGTTGSTVNFENSSGVSEFSIGAGGNTNVTNQLNANAGVFAARGNIGSGDDYLGTATNNNSSATPATVIGYQATLAGLTNSNGNLNTNNAFNASPVTAVTGNLFNAYYAGTGYNAILAYNNGTSTNTLIDGNGYLQNAALNNTIQYTNITGTGALTSGSIASGFGTISTANNITTSAAIQGGSISATTSVSAATVSATGALQGNNLNINSGAFAVSSTGAITASTAIANSGGYTQSGSTANSFSGALTESGLTTTNQLAVGTSFVGTSYKQGINLSGASGYVGLAVRGANGQTADLLENQDYNGIVQSKFGSNGQLTLGTIASSGVVYKGGLTLSDGTTDNYGVTFQSATQSNNLNLTIPAETNSSITSDTVCLYSLSNCVATGAASGDLTGTYPAPTIAKLQGKTLTISSTPATGAVLQYTGSAFQDGLITNTNLQSGAFANITGTGALTSGSIASGFGTISTANNITTSATVQGNIVNATGSGSSLQLGGTSINTPGILTNVAYLTATSQSFTGANTFSATGTALTVTNAASVGTLTVTTGGASITGNSSITGTLGVSGLLTASAGETETGTASLTGTTTINTTGSANTSIGASGSTTTITGTTNLNTTGSATTTIGNASSATSIGGTLAVTGATTLSTAAIQGAGGLTLGSTSNAGLLKFSDGTADGFYDTLAASGTLSATQNFTLPSAGGILCTTTTCATGSTGSFIQNGTAPQTNANIDIVGIAGNVAETVKGASGQDIADFITSSGSTPVASISNIGTVTAPIVNATTALDINGASINTAGTLSNVAYQNQANTFTFDNSFNGTGVGLAVSANATIGGTLAVTSSVTGGTYNGQTISSASSFTGTVTTASTINDGGALTVTGAPTATATSSLEQLGAAIVGGNALSNGGTYLGLNEPSTGAGSAADFENLQTAGASQYKITNTGAVTEASGLTIQSGGATISGAVSASTTVNAGTAYLYGNGVGTTGQVLRSNGTTGFVAASLQASDLTGSLFSLIGSTGTSQTVAAGATVSILAASGGNLTTFSNATDTVTVDIVANPTFSGTVTASKSGATALTVSGAPAASASSSLEQLGAAIVGGNALSNGGTYLGLNEPSTGAGSAADYLNFQTNSVSKFSVTNTGSLTTAGSITAAGLVTANAGITEVGAASINATGSATTNIGSATSATTVGGSLGVTAVTTTGGLSDTAASGAVAATIKGASGQDIVDFVASTGGTPIAKLDQAGNFTAVSGNFSSSNNSTLSSSTSNTNSVNTPVTANGYTINLAGTNNSNVGQNVLNGVNFANATAATNNVINGLYFGAAGSNGYTSILNVGGTQVINNAGVVQSVGIQGAYSGITGTGALASGSIASGFGTINTTNTITTSAAVQGGSVTATAALSGNTLSVGGGTFAVSAVGAITAVTGITTTGGYSQSGSGADNFTGIVTTSAGIIDNSTLSQTVATGTTSTLDALSASNTNVSATGDTVNAESIALAGSANTNASNVNNAISFANVAGAPAGNTFTGLNFGSGYTNILSANGSNIINGSGLVLTAGIQGAYSGLTGTGALASGSIASGFGTISTANTITTTAALQGGTVTGTTSLTAGTTTGATSGLIKILDGTTDGYYDSIALPLGTLSGNNAFTLPAAGGVLCTTTTCATGGSGSYIVNSPSQQSGENINLLASSGVAETIEGASGQNILVVENSSGTPVLNIGSGGNTNVLNLLNASAGVSAARGNIGSGDDYLGTATNNNSSATPATVIGYQATLAGLTNSNGNLNTNNAFNASPVTAVTGNLFNAYYAGTGYNAILAYNNGTSTNTLIDGNGYLQNAALNNTIQYTNITGTGALTSGSIASGFGTISTANNITTSATVQGNIVNATGSGSSLQLGGTSINTPGILTNVAYLTATSQSFTGANTFSATGTALTVTNAASVGTLTVTTGGASITGNSSITGTLGVSGLLTATGTGANELLVSGAPAASASSSLAQLGATAISGGATGGTFVGINEPSSGAGSAADFENFQKAGSSVLEVTTAGAVTEAGGLTVQSGGASVSGAISASTTVNAGTAYLANGSVGTTGQVLRSNGTTGFVASAIQGSDASGVFVQNVPTTTSSNTILPTVAGVVALTLKGTSNASTADILDLYNAGASQTLQDDFDNTGSLHVGQVIQPIGNNTINLGVSSTGTFANAYLGTSLNVASTTLSSTALTFTGSGSVASASGTNLSLDTGGSSSAVNIGTNNASAINIGSTVKSSGVNIGTGATGTQTVTIGSSNTTTSINLQAGTNTAVINSTNFTVAGPAVFTGTVAVQNAGGLTIGSNSASGILKLTDGTNDGFSDTIAGSGTLTATQNFTLPVAGGILCTTTTCATGSTTSFIQNSTTKQTAANFNIQSNAIGNVGATIQDITGQTADLLDLDNNSAIPLAKVDASGNLTAVAGTFSGLLTASNGETETGSASLTGTTSINTTGSATTTIGSATSATGVGGSLGVTGITTTGGLSDTATTGNVAATFKGAASQDIADFVASTSGTIQDYFDTAGSLHVAQVIQPTSTNTVNLGVVSSGTFANAYLGTSVNVAGTILTSTGLTFVGAGSVASATGTNLVVDSGSGSTTLNLGTANATTTNIGNAVAASAVNIGSGATGVQTVTIGSTNTAASINLQAGVNSDTVTSTGTTIKTSTNETTALQIQNNSSADLLDADTTNLRLGVDVTYSLMSPVTTLTTSTVTTGGNLAAATYYYKVTAIDASGGETTPSTEKSQATTGATSKVTVSWTAIAGASGYRIYRSTSSGSEVYLTTVLKNTFVDSGSFTPEVATAPATNNAYVASNVTNNELELSVGGNGTPAGQVYVSGSLPSSATGSTYIGNYNGQVVVSGSYAYIVNNVLGSVSIYDVSNPSDPTLLNKLTTSVQSVSVNGHYLYVVSYSASTLTIYDISNPSTPVSDGSVPLATNPFGLYVQGRYAYVVGYGNVLQVVDVSNPLKPSVVGSVSTGANSTPQQVYVQGRYAYVADNGSAGNFSIFDISNPTSPTTVSNTYISNSPAPYGVSVQGDYAYISGGNNQAIIAYNISNPATPVAAGVTAGSFASNYISVQGRYGYTSNTNTIGVYDISDPYSINTVGNITASGSTGLAVQGRYAYVTDGVAGGSFQIFDLGGEYSQQLQAGGLETGTLQVDTNAVIAGDTTLGGGLTVGQSAEIQGSLGVNGSVNLQNAVNSITALQVATATGSILLNADTSNARIGLGQLSAPGALTLSTATTGGSLPASTTYYYKVTAVDGAGGQSAPSTEYSIATGSGTATNTTTISWTAISGATSYDVYVGTTSGGESSYFTTPTNNYIQTAATGTAGTPVSVGSAYLNQFSATADYLNNVNGNGNAVFSASSDGLNTFQIQNDSSLANLLATSSSTANLSIDGGSEVAGGTFSNNWTAYGTATVTRTTTTGTYLSGTAAASVVTAAGAGRGVHNNLGSTLSAGSTYLVSFSAEASTAGPYTDEAAGYLYNGTTLDTGTNYANTCSSFSITNTWAKYTCYFTVGTSNTPTSANAFAIYGSVAHTLYIDNLSITPQTTNGTLNVNQVQIGGVAGQGLTVLTVDTAAAPPTTSATYNSGLLGSIYYDTTVGALECYGSSGWGACGASPNVSANLIPEYSGAVLDGSLFGTNDIGTLTSDLCSNVLGINKTTGDSTCSTSGTDYNYYKWNSPQSASQSYSIFVRYQLPATFKNFLAPGTVQLTGRSTDITTPGTGSGLQNGVRYTMYYTNGSGILTQCGNPTPVNTATNTWQTTSLNFTSGNEQGCTIAGGQSGGIGPNSVLTFKIDVTSTAGTSAYVSNLSFQTVGK